MTKPKRPKTQAERLADLVERREAEGLRRATFWLSEKARAVIAEAARVNRSSRDRAVEDGMLAFAALGFQQPAVESKALVLTDAKTGVLGIPVLADSSLRPDEMVFRDPKTGKRLASVVNVGAPASDKLPEAEKPASRPKVEGKVSKAAPGPSGGLSVPYGRPKVEPGSRLKKDAKRG